MPKSFYQLWEDIQDAGLQANLGQSKMNQTLKNLQKDNPPLYAEYERLRDRTPALHQQFMKEVQRLSGGTYNLTPAAYGQVIRNYSLKAGGTKLPPAISQPPADVSPTGIATGSKTPPGGMTPDVGMKPNVQPPS